MKCRSPHDRMTHWATPGAGALSPVLLLCVPSTRLAALRYVVPKATQVNCLMCITLGGAG